MSDPKSGEQYCGVSLRTFAMTSSLVSAVWLLVSSGLAFFSLSYLRTQQEIFAAEDSAHDDVLTNPKLVSTGLGVLFLLAAVGSGVLFAAAAWSPRRLRLAVICYFCLAFLLVAWEIGGGFMCWSSPMKSIEAACAVIDSECLPKYRKLMFSSIAVEVVGGLCIIWQLVTCHLFYAAAGKAPPPDHEDALPLVGSSPKLEQSLSKSQGRRSRRSNPSRTRESQTRRPTKEYSMSKSSRRSSSRRSSTSRRRRNDSSDSESSDSEPRRRNRNSRSRRR